VILQVAEAEYLLMIGSYWGWKPTSIYSNSAEEPYRLPDLRLGWSSISDLSYIERCGSDNELWNIGYLNGAL